MNRRQARLLVAAAVALSSPGLATRPAADAPVVAQAPASCNYSGPSSLFVPFTTVGAILIDPNCQYVYTSNTGLNRIEVYSLQTQAFLPPIPVGAGPKGMDFTPDGTQLYVANFGEHTVSVVSLATRTELRKITIPFDAMRDDRPVNIAIGNSGRALIVTGVVCCNSGYVMELVLATDVATRRTDYGTFAGVTIGEGRLVRSGDRSRIVVFEINNSGGTTTVYNAATNLFEASRRLDTSLSHAAVNHAGSTMWVHGFVLDPALSVFSVIGTGAGAALHANLGLAYRSLGTNLEVISLSTFLKIGERPLGDSVSNGNAFNAIGKMDASDDGTLLAVLTNFGFTIVKPFAFAPEKVTLIGNGDFAGGVTGWQMAAPAEVESAVAGGVLQFNRLASASAPAALQAIPYPFPAAAPIDIKVGLGNSGSSPRTIRVRAADGVGEDAHICTFVVPPLTPLATYRMRVVTSGPWADAVVDVDADTASGDEGYALVDNVSVMYDSTLVGGDTCVSPPPIPPAGTCQLSQPTVAVPLTGVYTAAMVDAGCRYVYFLNSDVNRVDVFSLQTLAFEEPIQVGSMPLGMDITADGRTMYVANGGGNNLSEVDLRQRVEVRKITLAPVVFFGSVRNEVPASVAIAGNGKALVATKSRCCTGPQDVQELNLATGQMAVRGDSPPGFSGMVRASRDGGVIFVGQNNTGGPVHVYRAALDALSAPLNSGTAILDLAVNGNGSRAYAMPANTLLDSTPSVLGSFTLTGTTRGAALHPTLALGYRPLGSAINVLNLDTVTQIGTLPLGGTTDTSNQLPGQVHISRNGRLLVARTTTGYSLVDVFADGPPQNVSMVQNGSFAAGANGWTTFATPDASYIDSRVMNGVFEFNRLPAPPGTTNQAVVFQHTGVPLPSGAPIQAQFDLGNSSMFRKRISVLLLDSNFSDLHVCSFWIQANSPLTTYRMRSHANRPWNDAAIYFYAATAGSDGGYNRLDNVSLQFNSTLPGDRTECEDPHAPTPPGGPDGPDLVGNGDFSGPALAPWATFGTITSQVAGGVFEFVRPDATPPAGVVLQPTGQTVGLQEILTATFDLGNSSTVRKRVTVLLHDNNFNDLSACTFWLAPGQLLSPYSMRVFATQAWSNATISVYAATVGPDQWTRLDNVTWRRTPAAAISGTDCVEPASAGPSQAARTSGAARPGLRARAVSDAAATIRTAPGASSDPLPGGGHVAGISEWIDLTRASQARLSLDARVLSDESAGEIEISVDGGEWRRLITVPASEDWTAVELDLSSWLGHWVAVRFVTPEAATRPVWLIRSFRVEIHR